jgi:beta-glucosidase
VTVDITDTGRRSGSEVVQVYVSDLQSRLARPPKELKGFSKVFLGPGEAQTVTIALDDRCLSYYGPSKSGRVPEPGEFEILVGRSSKDIRARASLRVL